MEIGGKTPEGLMGPNLGAQTPSMGYGRTPMYGGAQTPMYGGASTPMHDASRTPHYGLSTPAYGAQTPSHQGSAAWDPTVANTPAHSHFDEEFDPQGFGGTTPAFGGTTPGGATPSGFGGATPGGYGSNSYGSLNTPIIAYLFTITVCFEVMEALQQVMVILKDLEIRNRQAARFPVIHRQVRISGRDLASELLQVGP